MSVLDRVPAETRRKTGFVVPIVVGMLIGLFIPDTERVLGQSERLGTSGMIVAGFVAGMLWQWYSPRDLSERLTVPTAGVMAFGLLFLIPGEWSSRGPAFGVWFPIGVVAGLVFMTRQKTGKDNPTEEQPPGS